MTRRKVMLMLLALPASVAIWAGWVSLGLMCGFGKVKVLPGITDWELDTSITLPIGMEAYAAYALGVSLDEATPEAARKFAKWSSWAGLGVGMLGQAAYHTMTSWGWEKAPTPVVIFVACLPVIVLGAGARLMHLSGKAAEAPTLRPTTALPLSKAEWVAVEAAPEAAPRQLDAYRLPPLPHAEAEDICEAGDEAKILYLRQYEAAPPVSASSVEAVGPTEADLKAAACKLILSGQTVPAIATTLGVDKSTVYRYTKAVRHAQTKENVK